jgi:hypothetical protein
MCPVDEKSLQNQGQSYKWYYFCLSGMGFLGFKTLNQLYAEQQFFHL